MAYVVGNIRMSGTVIWRPNWSVNSRSACADIAQENSNSANKFCVVCLKFVFIGIPYSVV